MGLLTCHAPRHQPPERLDLKVKAIKSAELLELKKELADHERTELERKFAKKYHRVKFFERIKIERAISKLEKKMRGEGEGTELHHQRLHQLNEDLEYVMNFPPGERYVALLKDATDAVSQAHLDSERTRLRALIKHRMKESALVNEVDEGKSIQVTATQVVVAQSSGKPIKSRARAVVEAVIEKEDKEEDDFFLGKDEGEAEELPVLSKSSKSSLQPRLPFRDDGDDDDDDDDDENDEDDDDDKNEEERHLSRSTGGKGRRGRISHSSGGTRGGRGGGGGRDGGGRGGAKVQASEEADLKRKRSEGGRKRRK